MCVRSTVAVVDSALDYCLLLTFFFQAEDGIRDTSVTGVQTCALPICDDLKPYVHVRQVLRRTEEIAPRVDRVLHHHGDPKIRERSDGLSKKSRGSDAHNLK